jgi:hypothetical protein
VLLMMIFRYHLTGEEINVVPGSNERFRQLYTTLRNVSPEFRALLLEKMPFPRKSAVYVFDTIKSFSCTLRLPRWMGFPTGTNLTRDMAHIKLRFSGNWAAVEFELCIWNRTALRALPQLLTIEIQWRPRYAIYQRTGRKSLNHSAERYLRHFRVTKTNTDLENGILTGGPIVLNMTLEKTTNVPNLMDSDSETLAGDDSETQ